MFSKENLRLVKCTSAYKALSGRELAACTPEGECATKELPLFQNKRTAFCFTGSSTRLRGSPLSEGAKGDIAPNKRNAFDNPRKTQ